ncbi:MULTISPECIES: chromate transporter [Brevibacillus]|jgi:chromate transporter|uniref:Putative transporter YwrB n=1 Tax=Brevibacillus parabrevis TaxID=54914 RepID=A0A4Y3PIN9_BREPA|nr:MULTISPECIES: chromate transporter [Brevibacillus]MBU8715348.1 chromate transporter [Brevibacillus parabrevis]MDH6351978.1 chromate transporter [Brevibacillus sp. 1238]MDR4999710.1 chromate transporter [Brevibacillus parabrevis]MED1724868.1 chromate transporter [Brevibacillus parabrevis]MED2257042.1 chromate transporter [Brevibacillus parabrevis]
MVYWHLFLAFFRIGIFGFGGGPTMVPLFYTECVKKYKWVSDEDFSDNLALANALPGPIATKLAAFIGYRVKGWMGALVANIAVVMPIVLVMIGLLQVIYQWKDAPGVYGMIQAIGPVIAVMTGVLTWEFLAKGWKGAASKTGVSISLGLSLVALLFLDWHPGIVVGIALLVSFAYSTWSVRKRKKQDGKEGAA